MTCIKPRKLKGNKYQPCVSGYPRVPGAYDIGVRSEPDLEALEGLRPTDDPHRGDSIGSPHVNFHCREGRAPGSGIRWIYIYNR